MSEPMTDADLTAIERLLMYGVIGTDPADASGATTDDVAEVAGDLLAEAAQALADLDTWPWEDRQGALREWDQRIARVRDVQRRRR